MRQIPSEKLEAIDTLSAVIPFERRDFVAELLTDDDIATLRHLAKEGTGENTLRALMSDLAYLEAWSLCATGFPLPWPAPEALLIKFVAHHLYDPAKRDTDPDHGMPQKVEDALRSKGLLRTSGPHAPSTVQRRLASWSTLTRWRGLKGEFNAPGLKTATRLATRASARPKARKSAKAVTLDVLQEILKTCWSDSLTDRRDRAMLLLAFASGGRRRSEIARLRVEQLIDDAPVAADPLDPHSGMLPCMRIHLGRTKTTKADDAAFSLLIGAPVVALQSWLDAAGIKNGAVFRAINQWGTVQPRALTPDSVNAILKGRIAQAGLNPADYSAHGLRSGYLTEAARRGIPLPEAMQQSQHRSVSQAARYYNQAERANGKAARLIV